MKVLNLYAGIGGNRKLWQDVEVTAVEWDEETAKVYQDYFPNDEVIVIDAHEYLKENYSDFDFIWSSPPCPTHSKINTMANANGKRDPKFPDMKLYQEIIFLDQWFDGKWIVENVEPYYDYLIQPTKVINRHAFWSNFKLATYNVETDLLIKYSGIKHYEKEYGYDLSEYNFDSYHRRKALRNCVHPKIGNYILDRARDIIIKSDTEQTTLPI